MTRRRAQALLSTYQGDVTALVGGFTASPVLGRLHSAQLQPKGRVIARCASEPASPRRKGFPSSPRFDRRGARSPGNETVIGRSICAKLIKGKSEGVGVLPPLSVWFKEKGCGKAPEGVSLGPSAEPWPQSHKNRIKRKASLRSKKRFPRAPRRSGPAADQRSCPCYSRRSSHLTDHGLAG